MSVKLKDIESAITKSVVEYDSAITDQEREHWQHQIKLYEEMYEIQKARIKTKLLNQMEGLS